MADWWAPPSPPFCKFFLSFHTLITSPTTQYRISMYYVPITPHISLYHPYPMNAQQDLLITQFSSIFLPNLLLLPRKFIITIRLVVYSPPIPRYSDTIQTFNLLCYHKIFYLTIMFPLFISPLKIYFSTKISAATLFQKLHTVFKIFSTP